MAKTKKSAVRNQLGYFPDWSRVATTGGKKVVYCPDHPHAWVTGYVFAHRVIMEHKLGRLLQEGELVRFVDRDSWNLAPENLELATHKSVRQDAMRHLRPPLYKSSTCWWCRNTFYTGLYDTVRFVKGRFPFCSRTHLVAWTRAHKGKIDKAFSKA